MRDRAHPSFVPAVDVWREYAGAGNPLHVALDTGGITGNITGGGPAAGGADVAEAGDGGFAPTYYSFRAGGGACIFVPDTRGHRTPTSILGATQLAQLHAWLLLSNATCPFKIVASPVPVTPNYRSQEGWGSYPDLQTILAFAKDRSITGLVFLSGDSHMLGVYELAPGVLEVTASPIAAQAVPFLTIRNTPARVVWEQGDFGGDADEQFGLIDVHSAGPPAASGGTRTPPKLVVALYSRSAGFKTPVFEVEVKQDGVWAVTGGSQEERSGARSSADVAAGGAPMFPERGASAGGVGIALRMAGGMGLLIPLVFCLVAIVCVVACSCTCCARCRARLSAAATAAGADGCIPKAVSMCVGNSRCPVKGMHGDEQEKEKVLLEAGRGGFAPRTTATEPAADSVELDQPPPAKAVL